MQVVRAVIADGKIGGAHLGDDPKNEWRKLREQGGLSDQQIARIRDMLAQGLAPAAQADALQGIIEGPRGSVAPQPDPAVAAAAEAPTAAVVRAAERPAAATPAKPARPAARRPRPVANPRPTAFVQVDGSETRPTTGIARAVARPRDGRRLVMQRAWNELSQAERQQLLKAGLDPQTDLATTAHIRNRDNSAKTPQQMVDVILNRFAQGASHVVIDEVSANTAENVGKALDLLAKSNPRLRGKVSVYMVGGAKVGVSDSSTLGQSKIFQKAANFGASVAFETYVPAAAVNDPEKLRAWLGRSELQQRLKNLGDRGSILLGVDEAHLLTAKERGLPAARKRVLMDQRLEKIVNAAKRYLPDLAARGGIGAWAFGRNGTNGDIDSPQGLVTTFFAASTPR